MFDFIEESIPESTPQKSEAVPAPLEGVVYTMPSHRHAPSEPGKKSGGLMAVMVIVGLVVVVSGGAIWWVVFRPEAKPANPSAVSESTPSSSTVTPPATSTDTTTEPSDTTVPPVATVPATENPPGSSSSPTVSPVLDYVKSLDSDGDDLTDVEEHLFDSDSLQPDTDKDSHLDGEEVKFLYDPARATPAKLETGSSVTQYTNPTFKYSLLYPSAWVVDSVDKANREVMFSSATGEFFSLTAQDNPEKLSALEWYSTVYEPNVDTSSLQTMTYDTWTGVMSKNGLEVYITAKDDQGKVTTPYVYVFKYDLGGKKEMNFGTVFQMMIRSFFITDLSFKR